MAYEKTDPFFDEAGVQDMSFVNGRSGKRIRYAFQHDVTSVIASDKVVLIGSSQGLYALTELEA